MCKGIHRLATVATGDYATAIPKCQLSFRLTTGITTMTSRLLACVLFSVACLLTAQSLNAQFKLEKYDGGVKVVESGKVVADYQIKNGPKPIVWPIIGPNGEKMTRDYPMVQDSQDEKHDHPHHRSLWFTHGEVNGVDFWAEGEKMGKTEHQEFTKLTDGKNAVIATKNIWKSAEGKPILTDRRRLTFGSGADQSHTIDCEVLLLASEVDLHFGDTKEGTFAVRVNEAIKVDAKKGGKIINSAGDTDGNAWGKPADWVDYHGPIGNNVVGIAILCHPSTFHYPNRWHVRTYGLFAANPFGVSHFLGKSEMTDGTRIKKGEQLLFRYRVIIHKGDEKAAKIDEQFKNYADQKFEEL